MTCTSARTAPSQMQSPKLESADKSANRIQTLLAFGCLIGTACGEWPGSTIPSIRAEGVGLATRTQEVDTTRFTSGFRQRGEGGVFVKLTGEPTSSARMALSASGLMPPRGRDHLVSFDSLKIRTVWGRLTARQVQAIANLPFVLRVESSEDEVGIDVHGNSIQAINASASEITWNLERIRAPEMWTDFEATGERQTGQSTWQSVGIALLDKGGDYRQTYNASGWEFVSANPASPANYTGDGVAAYLGVHGTWVAGFLAAEPNNSMVAGVAPRAAIKVYKVLPETGTADWGYIVDALDQAWTDGVGVINMSFGNCGDEPPSAVEEAIEQFATRVPADAAYPGVGVTLVAAAGNGTQSSLGCSTTAVAYPGAYADVIAVAAVNDEDEHSSGLSVGPEVEITAPGICVDGLAVGGGVDSCISGTSFAAPHVSAVIAAVRARHPAWSATTIRSLLQQTAEKISGQGLPRDNTFGFGMVNGYAMLQALSTPPPFTFYITGPTVVGPNNYSCSSWSAVASGGSSPYSFTWSGLFTGNEITVSGTVPQSGGDLEVYVIDSAGAHGIGSIHITYDPNNQDYCE